MVLHLYPSFNTIINTVYIMSILHLCSRDVFGDQRRGLKTSLLCFLL